MKKSLSLGVVLLSATSSFLPVVSAETTSTGSLIDTTKIAHQNWMQTHCQIIKNGFQWTNPTNIYANKQSCLGITNTLIANNSYQKQLVKNFINMQNVKKNSENLSIADHDGTKMTRAIFEEYVHILNVAREYQETLKTTQISRSLWSKLLVLENEFLKKYPNFSDSLKENVAFAALKAGISVEEFRTLFTINNFAEIQKVYSKTTTLADNDIAILFAQENMNDTFNVVKKSEYSESDKKLSYMQFFPVSKTGNAIAVSDYTVELKNAPSWITTSPNVSLTTNNTITDTLMLFVDVDALKNISTTTMSDFELKLTNKKTGKVYTKTFHIQFRGADEKTENLFEMTLPALYPQFFSALVKDGASMNIKDSITLSK